MQDIESMEAKLYHAPWGPPETPWFTIPEEEYGAILYGFVPFQTYSDYKWPSQLVCELKVKLIRTGEVRTIRFYDIGKNPLVYSVNGVRFSTKVPLVPVDEAARLYNNIMKINNPNCEF